MSAPNFKPSDVWAVARAVRDRMPRYDDHGYNVYWECRYCDASINEQLGGPNDLRHKSHCPYLIALDLLTGAPSPHDEVYLTNAG